jgi:hypothetical protein
VSSRALPRTAGWKSTSWSGSITSASSPDRYGWANAGSGHDDHVHAVNGARQIGGQQVGYGFPLDVTGEPDAAAFLDRGVVTFEAREDVDAVPFQRHVAGYGLTHVARADDCDFSHESS